MNFPNKGISNAKTLHCMRNDWETCNQNKGKFPYGSSPLVSHDFAGHHLQHLEAYNKRRVLQGM
jgi:hypothetical protein